MLTPSTNKALEASSPSAQDSQMMTNETNPVPPYTELKVDDAAIGADYQKACGSGFHSVRLAKTNDHRFCFLQYLLGAPVAIIR